MHCTSFSFGNRACLAAVILSLATLFVGCGKAHEKATSRNPALEGVYRAADGTIATLRPPTDGLTVLFFYSTECPIANFYMPVVNELVRRHGTDRIRWVGACVDPDLSSEARLKHVRDHEIAFPVITDGRGELARAIGVTVTPEAAVFDSGGRLIYRGRIDDHYAKRGVKAATVESHDLDEAVKAGLAGRQPATRQTAPIGCPLPEVGPKQDVPITYAEHIAPIIFRRCLECHREGAIAPFPLETYAQARRRASDLADVTRSRFMPPQRLDPRFGQRIQHDLSLADAEIDLIAAWADQGAIEGDPASVPEMPSFPAGWTFGVPDLVLEMSEPFVVPATGPDILRCFPIPIGLTEDRYVSAIEIQPGNSRIVHHSINYLVARGAGTRKDEADPGPGYDCFGGPGVTIIGELGAWAPGARPDRLPSGLARRLPAGSDLIVNVHYHPSGKEEIDRSRIGIFFSKQPVRQSFQWMLLVPTDFRIPPGASNHELSASREIPMDLMVHMVAPHMHLLGKDMTVWFEKPDGTRVDLVRADPWDFKWQLSRYLLEPVFMPKGSVIRIVGHYDNSSANPANPFRAVPREIGPGEDTTDEMLACVIGVTKVGQNLARDGYETDTALFVSDWKRPTDTAGWQLWAAPGAEDASLEMTPIGVRIHVPAAERQTPMPKAHVRHVTRILKGHQYEVILRIKADAPRTVQFVGRQNRPPWTALCEMETLQLTEHWQVFRKTFSIDRDERNAQIVIVAEADGISFDIAEFSIKAGTPAETSSDSIEVTQTEPPTSPSALDQR